LCFSLVYFHVLPVVPPATICDVMTEYATALLMGQQGVSIYQRLTFLTVGCHASHALCLCAEVLLQRILSFSRLVFVLLIYCCCCYHYNHHHQQQQLCHFLLLFLF
jgi:hypothetical protein